MSISRWPEPSLPASVPTPGSTLPGPCGPEKRPLALQGQPPAPRLRRASGGLGSAAHRVLHLCPPPRSHKLPRAQSPTATPSCSSPSALTCILSPPSPERLLCAPHQRDEIDLAPGLTGLMAERMDRPHWGIAGGPELTVLREREVKGSNLMAGAMEGSRGQAGLSQAWAGDHECQRRREGGAPGRRKACAKSWGELRSSLQSAPYGAGRGAMPARSPASGPPGGGPPGLCPQDNRRPSGA